MRPMMRTLVVGAVLATGACYAYRAVDTAPRPGTRVRIVLVSGTEVITTSPSGMIRSHGGVLEVSGTIHAAAADTVTVRLGELRTAEGVVPGVSGEIALLPAARLSRIEQRQFLPGATALTGIGVVTLAVAAFLVVVIGSITQGF